MKDSAAHASTWPLGLSAAAPFLILLPTLLYPYGRDQSVFAYVGGAIARGEMPYRDVWDLKPPGIYLLYAALAAVTRGDPDGMMLAVRIADVAIAAATGLLIAIIARRFGRPDVGLAASAWYAALYLHGTYWSMAQAEAWANPLVLLAILLVLPAALDSSGGEPETGRRAPPPIRIFGASGLLLGMAALLKFTAVLPALPFLMAALAVRQSGRLLCVTVLTISAAAPLAGAAAWLLAGDAWGHYVDIQRGFVAPYARLNAPTLLQRLANVFGHTFGWLGSAWLPGALALAGAMLPGAWRGDKKALLVAALGCGLLAAWVQNKYFGYHWQTALPWLSLLAAAGTVEMLRRVRMPVSGLPTAGAAVALAWSVAAHWSHYRDWASVPSGGARRDMWYARFGTPGRKDYSFAAASWAADYVRAYTRASDTVLVWGFEPSVYLLSERRPPTRFFFNVPVTAPFAPEHWRREYLDAVRAHPPELVLVLREDRIPWANGRTDDSTDQLHAWVELKEWLDTHYRLETAIEHFAVYRRVTTAPRGAPSRGGGRSP